MYLYNQCPKGVRKGKDTLGEVVQKSKGTLTPSGGDELPLIKRIGVRHNPK